MKNTKDLKLSENVREALQAARDRLGAEFSIDRIVLFGSVVRGTAGEGSDTDLLVVLKEPLDHNVRNRISSIILDINLEYGTLLSNYESNKFNWLQASSV